MPARNLRLDTILTRHQVFVSRLSVGEANKFAKFLKEMDRELRARLSGNNLTEYSRRRLESQLTDIEKMLAEIYERFGRTVRKSLVDIANHEASFTAKSLNTVVDIESAIPGTSQIRAAVFGNPLRAGGGKLLDSFLKDWSAAEIKSVSGAIRRGVFEGQTNTQIVQAIRGTAAKRYQDGLLETTARHARAVVQTAVQHASTTARMETFKENADIVKGVQWLATLDNRTCFAAGTPVDTPEGPKAIESLRPGDSVIGGSRVARSVLATTRRRSARRVRVTLSNGKTVICTADHQWLTRRGWVDAGELLAGELLASKL